MPSPAGSVQAAMAASTRGRSSGCSPATKTSISTGAPGGRPHIARRRSSHSSVLVAGSQE